MQPGEGSVAEDGGWESRDSGGARRSQAGTWARGFVGGRAPHRRGIRGSEPEGVCGADRPAWLVTLAPQDPGPAQGCWAETGKVTLPGPLPLLPRVRPCAERRGPARGRTVAGC